MAPTRPGDPRAPGSPLGPCMYWLSVVIQSPGGPKTETTTLLVFSTLYFHLKTSSKVSFGMSFLNLQTVESSYIS